MTDRKPDILTSWKIKQNTDGSYTARCPAMPNVELTAENVVTILSKIERCLKSMYPDNSTVDGGISCINAEYSVTKRQEMSLDSFEMPTDDPTPEPATDAPELHEVQRTCDNCGKITYCPKHNESSDFIAPENCGEFQLATRFVEPIEQKKPRKSRAKKTAKAPVEEPLIQAPKKPANKTTKKSSKSTQYTRCKDCKMYEKGSCLAGHEPNTCKHSCDTCFDVFVNEDGDKFCKCKDSDSFEELVTNEIICKHYATKCDDKYELRHTCHHCIHRRDNLKCACEQSEFYGEHRDELAFACENYKSTKQRLDELVNEDPEYEANVQEHIEKNKGYVWKRIKTLEDTCGNCIKCGADCNGNPRGEPCENYNACNNSSEQCVKCEHMSRGYGNTGFCTLHNDTVGHDDYACKSFVLSEKIKEWSKEE